MSRSRAAAVVPVLAALLLAAAPRCAKKMLPPSPDRFPPQLEAVDARTSTQIELVFDEAIDAGRLAADSIGLTDATGARHALRGSARGREADRVLLWTERLAPGLYTVQGRAFDLAGNAGRFRARFRGSERRDTIAPRVVRVEPSPGSAGARRRPSVAVHFSEPVDTSASPRPLFVPRTVDTLFRRTWDAGWQVLSYASADSLPAGTVVYFLLSRGVADLDGNRLRSCAYTYFTADSMFAADPVKGRAVTQAGPLGTGVVFFQQDKTRALAPVLADGSFATRLPRGEYEVVVAADTNDDGIADLVGSVAGFTTGSDSVRVVLEPEKAPVPIDSYCH